MMNTSNNNKEYKMKNTTQALQKISEYQKGELIRNWHTSIMVSHKRVDRLRYVMDEFMKKYPELRRASVYKHLTSLIAN